MILLLFVIAFTRLTQEHFPSLVTLKKLVSQIFKQQYIVVFGAMWPYLRWCAIKPREINKHFVQKNIKDKQFFKLFLSSWISSSLYWPFQTTNQSMFTEVAVVNQWHCRAHNNLCSTLHKRTCAFCLWANLCEQLTQEWIEKGKRTIAGGNLYVLSQNAEPSIITIIIII